MRNLALSILFCIFGSNAIAGDVTANHCEAFINQVNITGSGEENGGDFFDFTVKVNSERLDGPVTKVVLHYTAIGSSTWKDAEFINNQDGTYSSGLRIADVFGPPREYTGVIFVETTQGTRYWIKSNKDNGNFFFTVDLMNHIQNEKNVVLSYLNPLSCH